MISYLCCVYTPIDFQVTTIPYTHRHAECLCEAIWWRHDTDILQQRRAGTCLASWPREHQLAWGLAGKWSAAFSNVNDLPRYRNYTCFVSLLCLINGLGVSLDVCKDLMHLCDSAAVWGEGWRRLIEFYCHWWHHLLDPQLPHTRFALKPKLKSTWNQNEPHLLSQAPSCHL